MRAYSDSEIFRRLGRWGLIFSAHFDALRAEPRAYCVAAYWWMRRKKLRARGRLEPLFAHSRRLYDLWLLREDNSEPDHINTSGLDPIFAFVSPHGDAEDVEASVKSLIAEGICLLSNNDHLSAHFSQDRGREEKKWFMLLNAGDTLAPGAAMIYQAAISKTDAHVIYADDDLINYKSRRTAPHFKPDWNGELFQHFDYVSSSCILRLSRKDCEIFAGSTEELFIKQRDLIASLADEDAPTHVRKILHHRKARPLPRISAALPRKKRALPTISIIVPTRNRYDLLKTCLSGISATEYPNHVEIIIVDNNSDDPLTLSYLASLNPDIYRILRYPGAFNFSAINNYAVAEATGQLLCFLNNDIEVINRDWLEVMAVQAMRDDVGAVGAQLLYPDGRIQHAGVVIGVGNAAGHAHRLLDPETEGYFQRHKLPQFVSAVTAGCLVVSRDRFRAVEGFDEKKFAVAFNDVDLCLRLNRRGWQSLYEPRAALVHHESVSRGFDRDKIGAARLTREVEALKSAWSTDKVTDPFHHPALSRASEQFVIGL